MNSATPLPPVVSAAEWQTELSALRAKEKAATRALDALAAERRRLPMVEFGTNYTFTHIDAQSRGPNDARSASLLELFAGRRQLVAYHFMWHGDGTFCKGCTSMIDNVGHLAHLNARDTTLALIYRGPLAEIESHRARMGWTLPVYSSAGSTFDADCGLGTGFGLSVFLRNGDRVFRTYFTTARGADRLRIDFNLLDLTPYGRQEAWEDSPAGWPQTPPYSWWQLHDEY